MINLNQTIKQQLFYGVALTVIVMTVILIWTSYNDQKQYSTNSDTLATTTSEIIPAINNQLNINASAGLVWDKKTNTFLFEKNSNATLPIASITKLLTAISALEFLPHNTTITLNQQDLSTEGSSGLIANETWNVNDLVSFMLITSSNDAATALARVIREQTGQDTVTTFNMISRKLQLKNYVWKNPTGLDIIDGVEASNQASTTDIVKLADYLLTKYPRIALASGQNNAVYSSDFISHSAFTTNELATDIPHTLSAKTGFTFVAGGNLVVIADAGPARPIYIVVLGSSASERFNDVEKLYNYSLDQLTAL